MPIDYTAVRKAFYGALLASPPDHLPTPEEVLAEHQRICVQCTIDLGIDTSTRAIGEHGSLIGGHGKPLTLIARPVERLLRLEPMPLEWFDYPQARRAWRGTVDESTAYRECIEFLEEVIHCHLAGYPSPPTASELRSWICSPASSNPRKAVLYNIFENISSGQCARMLSRGHFSVYEVARILILSEARAPDMIGWLHQFSVDPSQHSEDGLAGALSAEPAPNSPRTGPSG